MKTISALMLLAMAVYVPGAFAQCATGVDTGGQCIPPEVLQSQGNRNQQQNSQSPPQAIWSDRWGAIAEDFHASRVGTVVGQTSKSLAEEAALSNCAGNGGQHCEITLTYYNQCAAVAVDENNLTLASRASAPTEEKAKQIALNGFGPGHVPKIVYSACSLPIRIQ